jgi:hypothetical protein
MGRVDHDATAAMGRTRAASPDSAVLALALLGMHPLALITEQLGSFIEDNATPQTPRCA